jgi:hypothetical protein
MMGAESEASGTEEAERAGAMVVGRLRISVQELMLKLSDGDWMDVLGAFDLVADARPGCEGVMVVVAEWDAERVEGVLWHLGALEGGRHVGH